MARMKTIAVPLATKEVYGLKELTRALSYLPEAIQKEAQRTGVKEGLEAIAQGIRDRAPVGDRSSTRYAKKNRKAAKALSRRITVRMNSKNSSRVSGVVNVNAPHAHLVEFGHRIVTTGKAKPPKGPRKDTGKRAKFTPFVRSGFRAKEDEALSKLVQSIDKAIDMAW